MISRGLFNMRPAHGVAAALAIGLVALFLADAAYANTDAADTPNWLHMLMGLFGGLALFLFGMEQMGDGLKAVAGARLKDILAKFTKNRVVAAFTGAVVTAVIQSSSVTTVLVVGFVSAGVMTFTQSVGVIMGANVGTTVTAQIVAFKVEELALAFIAIGFALLFGAKRDNLKNYGAILMGLGLVFYGMSVMSDAMRPLRTYEPFTVLMGSMDNPFYGIAVAAAFTALVQSSSATTGLVIVMASQGLISLQAGIALALGANIGTCVTALLATIGKPTHAIRAGVVHVLFNVIGALLWIGLIEQLADFAIQVSPSSEGLSGSDRLAADTPRQIANANTIFNLANTVLLLAFAGPIAKAATALVPSRPEKPTQIAKPKYLDRELLEVPALGLERVRLELGHMAEILSAMFDALGEAFETRDSRKLDRLRRLDDGVNVLQHAVFGYLGGLRKQGLTDEESQALQKLFQATGAVEAMGDQMSDRIVSIAAKWLEKDMRASPAMSAIMRPLFRKTAETAIASIGAVQAVDELAAQSVLASEAEIERLISDALRHQSEQIELDDARHLEAIRMEMEMVESMRDLHRLSCDIARTVLPVAVLSERN
ncbi:MAG: Na/Pi cotransporter family protein [Alphaproteobacteria bacterium]|nr:Na/Pi cotransporter family protein [Alphaproteobacteria bacterium]